MSQEHASVPIEYFELLGRRVRLDDWQSQKASTYRKIHEALDAGDADAAVKLANYFGDEAKAIYSIYRQWLLDLRAFMLGRGMTQERYAEVEGEVLGHLRLPDGRAWDPHREWHDFTEALEAFTPLAVRGEREAAARQLDEAKELWRRIHDRDVDHIYGLSHAVKATWGEAMIGPMYESVLKPLFLWRYEKFDIDKNRWEDALKTLMLVACEGMRGHLCGPERTGDFELIEEDDRYILRFDPCGSGGHTIRPDRIEGTPPRMQAPYNWSVSEEPHTWNHGEKGMCLYCSHCVQLLEEFPIDRFGYPVRVVDPPLYDEATATSGEPPKCRWQMFKDPTAVPEEYYRRVGREKPAVFGSKALGVDDLESTSAGYSGKG